MIPSTFNDQTVYVLNDAWNEDFPFQVTLGLLRDNQVSLTRRESRLPFSATLLASKITFRATVLDGDVRKLKASLRAMTTEQAILPLWPLLTTWADRATAQVSGGLKIAFKSDWSQFEIYTDVEPAWPEATDNFAPALMGFVSNAKAPFINPDALTWPIEFVESSPAAYALQPVAYTAPAGPQPAGYTSAPPLCPFRPDFSNIAEQVGVDVIRKQIGFGRQQAQTFYPHAAALSQDADYLITSDAVGQFLRFFQDVAAPGAVFWTPGWIECARLRQNALATDSVLTVEDTSAVDVGDYVSIFADEQIASRKISAKTANTITLDSAIGFALSTDTALILPLCLARLSKPTISLSWKSQEAVSVKLSWSEVPTELAIPADETVGVSLGKLPSRIVLIQFTRDLRNGTVLNWYFTSYEEDVIYNGITWTSADIECGDITRGINFSNDGCEITADAFLGNPLIDDLTKRAEAPLQVTVLFAVPDTGIPGIRIVEEGGGDTLQDAGGGTIEGAGGD